MPGSSTPLPLGVAKRLGDWEYEFAARVETLSPGSFAGRAQELLALVADHPNGLAGYVPRPPARLHRAAGAAARGPGALAHLARVSAGGPAGRHPYAGGRAGVAAAPRRQRDASDAAPGCQPVRPGARPTPWPEAPCECTRVGDGEAQICHVAFTMIDPPESARTRRSRPPEGTTAGAAARAGRARPVARARRRSSSAPPADSSTSSNSSRSPRTWSATPSPRRPSCCP